METIQARPRYRNLPVVAIVGRPNAGKSTLFNRLLRQRRAITDPTPGVTRDPVEAECELPFSGKRVLLVDTGGFTVDRSGLDAEVVRRSLETIRRADLVILLMDVTAVTPEDQHFIELLRPMAPKVLLAVNKADSPERDALTYEFLSYGFADTVFISAEHSRNIDELEERIVSRLDFSGVEEYQDLHDDVRLAIVGKPNTGKSTLMNRLLGQEMSLVSDQAGTTRDVVQASFESRGWRFTVMDTAGIRRRAKVREGLEYYSVTRAIKSVEECDVAVLMIDAREGLTDQDKKVAAVAAERGRGIILALNKWDQMPAIKNAFEAARDKLYYFFPQLSYVPVLPISARDGTGVDELLSTAVRLFKQLNRRVDTGPLNKALEGWMERYPPPVGRSTHFKLRYATQVSANPLRFVFFASRPGAVTDAYVSYLKNCIRKDLGFSSVPVAVEVRGTDRQRIDKREGGAKSPRAAKGGEGGAPKSPAKKPRADAKAPPGQSKGSGGAPAKDNAPRPSKGGSGTGRRGAGKRSAGGRGK
jgi:GTP-binding protein